jgi:hypothetical protein
MARWLRRATKTGAGCAPVAVFAVAWLPCRQGRRRLLAGFRLGLQPAHGARPPVAGHFKGHRLYDGRALEAFDHLAQHRHHRD